MELEMRLEQQRLLADCISKSIYGIDFRWEEFFKLWFRKYGQPLFFLFKKNLSVTNTQYAELFSLIMRYSSKKTNNHAKLLFYSTEHIKNSFTDVVNSILEDYKEGDFSKINNFSDKYLDVLSATVAIDMFFGSCAIFLPHGIDIDLEKIVNDSGYIHSAGKSIFIRNIKKAKKNDFLNSIATHLKDNPNNEAIPFIVYSHEDFTAFDRDSSDLIDKGIEQNKIFLEKMSMGSFRLSTIINELHDLYTNNNKLLIPEPGNFLENHSFKKANTIWLITDRSISGNIISNQGNNRYYICYDQFLKNDSPFYYFDENKPAWKSHTTLPHSLTASLINIARPIIEDGVICDPFGGTGTTWFEIKRLQLKSKIICSDLSPATNLLIEDNLIFFTLSSNDLVKLKSDLKKCNITETPENQYKISFDEIALQQSPYDYAIQKIEDLKINQKDEDQEFSLSNSLVEELKGQPFLTRIIFYIGLRAELRFQGGFKRKSLTFENAFKKSLDKLVEQFDMLIELKTEVESSISSNEAVISDSYIKVLSRYSQRLIPNLIFDSRVKYSELLSSEVMSSCDARNLNPNSIDLIICDPPYGFNTSEDDNKLANLYSDFIDKAISSLRPQGQLIICLPGESYTGRNLAYCTKSDLVSRQIILKAHKQGRIVYRPAQSLPYSFTAPYYWESERALRRTILHFYFF